MGKFSKALSSLFIALALIGGLSYLKHSADPQNTQLQDQIKISKAEASSKIQAQEKINKATGRSLSLSSDEKNQKLTDLSSTTPDPSWITDKLVQHAARIAQKQSPYINTSKHISIALKSSEAKAALQIALNELQSPLALEDFGAPTSHSMESKHLQNQKYYEYPQVYNGIPIDGASTKVMSKQTPKGEQVVFVEQRRTPSPAPLSTEQKIDNEEIMEIAQTAAGVQPAATLHRNERLIRWFAGVPHVTQVVQFQGSPFEISVDIQSGHHWKEKKLYAVNKKGIIKGHLVLENGVDGPKETSAEVRLSHLKLFDSTGAQILANEQGEFESDKLSLESVLTPGLSGRYFDVTTKQGQPIAPEIKKAYSLATPDLEVVFNNGSLADQYPTAQVNAYYHANHIRDWLVKRKVNHSKMVELVPTAVNIDRECNAYYVAGTINFFAEGGRCRNTAYDTVVYHEYGHLVDALYGGITDGGLSEGWGDVLAFYSTSQPVLGKGFEKTKPNDGIRHGENTYVYPESGTDSVHKLGQAWMGFAWKLREGLIQRYGKSKGAEVSEELILPSLVSNARSIPVAVQEVLARDDNDGDLSNRTPHWDIIAQAASRHGLEKFLK